MNKGDRLDRAAQLKPAMYIRGMEQVYIDMVENPALIDALVEHITTYYLDYNERVFRAIAGKADIFMMGDDFGTQQGPMISLEMWRRFFRKGFRAYIDQAHRHGIMIFTNVLSLPPWQERECMRRPIELGSDVVQFDNVDLFFEVLEEIKKEQGG